MYIPGINPYILHIGSFGIRWYGFFMAVSMAIGIWYMVKRLAGKLGEDFVYNLALVAIVTGVIGARLVFVLTNPGYFLQHLAEIPAVYLGGLSIHGAIGGGVLGVWWYCRRCKKPLWPVLDATVYGIVWGIILVRIGNIFNQEILGRPSAFWFGRHPSQIYEMIMGAILLYNFLRRSRQNPADGFLFWNFFVWYTVMRFISEAFRDNPLYLIHYVNTTYGFGFVTLEQWFTPLLFVIALLAMRWRLRMGEHALEAMPEALGVAGAAPVGEEPVPASGETEEQSPASGDAGEHLPANGDPEGPVPAPGNRIELAVHEPAPAGDEPEPPAKPAPKPRSTRSRRRPAAAEPESGSAPSGGDEDSSRDAPR
ncbi:MAG TPA: prolipoprotein diacylglyceryl transferase family protein [Bacillota bacterium]|nr:prolipoprotein diacylglyceryl transferase family protein [Bacillota bacterium]